MGRFQSLRERIFPPAPKPLEKGIHLQRSPVGSEERFRLHLRVEENGEGILVINASKVLHVNQTATEYIRLLMEGKDADAVVNEVRQRYRVSEKQACEDYERLRYTVDILTKRDDICPVSYLDVERIEPFETPVSAPYRMDLAITYRCNNNCGHCYVARSRDMDELDTAQWEVIIDKLWDAGIPHVCFTGGEATLRHDLAKLIEHAQDVGIVTGLLTNGRKLSDKPYLQELVDAGLDHVQITIESHDEGIHNKMVGAKAWRETVQGIENALDSDVYTITNTTLTSMNVSGVEQIVQFLADLGVNTKIC